MAIASQGVELLPLDEHLAQIGMTPSAWKKQWESRRGEIANLLKRSRESDDSPQDKDPAIMREYLRRLRAEGEEKALLWALDRNTAEKK